MSHLINPTGAEPVRHSLSEDAQGIAFGVLMMSFSVVLLTHLGFVTGQTAGLAVVISYLTGWPFGAVFLVINLPFFALALWRMGARFTLKTLIAVAGLSGLSAALPQLIVLGPVNPILGAVLFGAVAGAGLLALFRHGASLGGVGILAFYLQDRIGFRAGLTQLIFDICLFALAFVLLDPVKVGYSLLGSIVLNAVIAVNHRRDHYVAI